MIEGLIISLSNPLPNMRVQVPTSVNVKELVSQLDLSRTLKENTKNRIYFFLSRIVSTNDNYELYKDNDGFRNVSSVYMRNVIGKEQYKDILDLLKNPADPIIESNNSFQCPQSDGENGFCKGYRLTEKYNTGEIIYKSLPRKFREKIKRHTKKVAEEYLIDVDYQFLLDQFEHHKFTFTPSVYNYLKAFGNILLSRAENNRYRRTMVLNLIGRWLYEVDKIQELEPWRLLSPKNIRIHSILTNLNSKLRPFLLCDGQPLWLIDVISSHPYTLSTILSDRFISGTGSGFNLRTIYPEIIDELIESGVITRVDTTYHKSGFEYSSMATGTTSSFVSDSSGRYEKDYRSNSYPFKWSVFSDGYEKDYHSNSYPFKWSVLSDKNDKENIDEYCRAPFKSDFYKDFVLKSQVVSDNIEERRQEFKDDMMLIQYDDDKRHRNNIRSIILFNEVYPGVNKWINQMHDSIGNSKFSYLLQRAESYLLLNVVARQFHDKFPTAPLFSIHDALLTHEEYLPDLQRLIQENYRRLTGIDVGSRIKPEKLNLKPKLEDIDEVWRKIRPIRDREKFEKVRDGVFMSNIRRGAEFLEKAIY